MNILFSKTAAEVEALDRFSGVQCDAQRFAEHAADAHLAAIDSDTVKAACSLWWSKVPAQAGEKIGLIGHFSATDASAVDLLAAALQELRARACTFAVGPMDGSTWHSYRFVTEPGTELPYFLEPQNPPEWPRYFEQAGFTQIAQYYSALNTNLASEDPRMGRAEDRLRDMGVTIRHATSESLPDDLDAIFSISLESFANNFLYTPLDREAFLEQYHRVLPYVDPRLVLVAEHNDQAVGFIFAIPDLLQRQRGAAINTVIIKTVAILPKASLRGLGSVLVARLHSMAHELGYKRVIHALMHENNTSLNVSRHYATVMRRYTLYSRSLRA